MAKTIEVAEQSKTNEALERIKAPTERFTSFLGDVRSEMHKVATPAPAEVRATTTVVIATVFAFAAYFWAVDYGINHTLNALITRLTTR